MNQYELVAVITGGSGLIGREIVKKLLLDGIVVCNFDMIDLKLLDKNYFHYHVDITSEIQVREGLETVFKKHKSINYLVNNAYPRTNDWGLSFEDIPLGSWRANIDMQLNSIFYITQQAIKYFKLNTTSSIVNIASIYGVVGNNFNIYKNTEMEPPAAYSVIKGGIISFTRFLASKYAHEKIRINCVSPGGIFDNQSEKFVKAYENQVPMKRMGNPDDIAPAVCFLLSEEAKYITGQNLIVDGGWCAI